MKLPILLVLLIVSLGCQSVSEVILDKKDGTALVQRTISDPHSFSTTSQHTWLESCTLTKSVEVITSYEGNKYNKEVNNLSNCKQVSPYQSVSSTGYIQGLAAPLIQAGGMIGAGALIGDGLRDSGSITNNSNTNNIINKKH